MASFGDQLAAARVAHLTATAIETQARSMINTAFDKWDKGELNARSVRHELENVVRAAYRSSAAIASNHASSQTDIPGWKPSSATFLTPYLTDLVKDVQRNLRTYKESGKTEPARRRAILNMKHSAGVAAQRGYTDSIIASYGELADKGYTLIKVWVANFKDNTPCPICHGLHGTEAPLRSPYPFSANSKVKVYRDLMGPPRHPQCRCYIVVLIRTLDNAFEKVDLDAPVATNEPDSLSSGDVAKLPLATFMGVVKSLQAMVAYIRGSQS